MKTLLNKIFKFLDDDTVQKKLKKVNLLVALISIFYLIYLINQNFKLNLFNLKKINLFELLILLFVYFLVGHTWVKFSNKDKTIYNKKIFYDWAYSNLGKYFPGGLGLVSIRLNQDDESKDSKKVFIGLLEEQFLIPLLTLPVLFLSTFYIDSKNFFLLFFLSQIIIYFVIKSIYFLNKKIKKISLLNQSLYLLPYLLLNQFLIFFIFYNFGFKNYITYSIIYLISVNLGLFFVGVPAGFGVREIIFLFLSNGDVNLSNQLEVIIYIRILYLIVDISYGLFGLLMKNRISK